LAYAIVEIPPNATAFLVLRLQQTERQLTKRPFRLLQFTLRFPSLLNLVSQRLISTDSLGEIARDFSETN